MKALVTGITGFAGGHLAAHLFAEGDQVLGTSRRAGACALDPWHLLAPGEFASQMQAAGAGRQSAALEELAKASAELQQAGQPAELSRAQKLVADVAERVRGVNLAKLLPGGKGPSIPLVVWNVTEPAPVDVVAQISAFAPDAIYHLAAESIPMQCGDAEPTAAAWAANVGSVSNVLALAESLPRRPRVLVVSSSHVYAPLTALSPPLSEDFPVAPAKGYGRTKLAAEHEAERAATGGLEVVIARAFNHSGPGQWPPLMLPEWCQQLAEASLEPLKIQTSNGWLDLSDVRDVVQAYRRMIERGAPGAVYNVGAGRAMRTGDILAELLAIAGGPRQVVETSPRTVYGHVADTARLFQATGWQPKIPLRDTLVDTLAWWRTAPRRAGTSSSSDP